MIWVPYPCFLGVDLVVIRVVFLVFGGWGQVLEMLIRREEASVWMLTLIVLFWHCVVASNAFFSRFENREHRSFGVMRVFGIWPCQDRVIFWALYCSVSWYRIRVISSEPVWMPGLLVRVVKV